MNYFRVASASACILVLIGITTAGSLNAQVVFDDSFADGDRAATEATDTNWWTSNTSAGIEISTGALGLVSGPSGRGIHTAFDTQTLTNVGDSITATFTFTTPPTIGMTSASIRIGLFDDLGRALDADIDASELMPNALYGDTGSGGSEDGLPGYMMDLDVNPLSGFAADMNFREHNIENATGQLMATTGTGSFSSFNSGPDEGYTFAPNTSYTGTFAITLVSPTVLRVHGTLGDVVYSATDDSFTSTSYGFLGFHVNSETFGSSDVPGEADNGIDFTNVNVVFTPAIAASPQSVFDDTFADGDRAATEANDTNWWTSSSSSGIEAEVGSLGLVTGTSGRGIHTVFDTQTLAEVGDRIEATYTFTTPATVGSGSSAAFRVGFYDTLGRAGLDDDVNASSGMPNVLYGWSVGNGGPGDIGLPGFMLDMDVNTGPTADLNFRVHNVDSATGRLMATTGSGSFSSLSSGPDVGYAFAPNTTYTGSYSIELISPTLIAITGTLDGQTHSMVTNSFTSTDFGMFGFHNNSNQFGSTNAAGEPDNGIDFSSISMDFYTTSTGPTVVRGDSLNVTRGTLNMGGLVELADSDNSDLSIFRASSDVLSRTEFEVEAFSPTGTPTMFDVTLEGSVFARNTVNQWIDLWDFDTAAWEEVDMRAAMRFSDSTVTVSPTGDLSRFVETGVGTIRARVRFRSPVNRQRFTSNTDQFIWTIE